MKIDKARLQGGELILTTSDPAAAQFVYKFQSGEYDIEKHREKRSLRANDYCWVLCDLIAKAVGGQKEDIYRDAVHAVGIYRDFHSILPAEAPSLIKLWMRQGTGWLCEQLDYEPDGDHVVIRGYFGSSVYNTRQMSRLIDWLITEAKELEIETLPPEKIAAMMREWNNVKK